jgi:glycine/D-amino acid oxidase-like deaminating enzyme
VSRITIETPIEFNDNLPDEVDVVIIGGGIVGIFSALYLARMGKRVLVCEKGLVAGEQSSRNWGFIRQQSRDYAELPIMMQALGLWHEVDRETNGLCGVVTAGTYYFAKTQSEMAAYESWISTARDHGLDSRIISAKAFIRRVMHGVNHGSPCPPSRGWLAARAHSFVRTVPSGHWTLRRGKSVAL